MNANRDPSTVLAGGSDAPNQPSEPQFLVVGRILRPHGVRGELRTEILTDYPERFAVYQLLYLGSDHQPYKLEKHRFHKGAVLLTLEGIDDRTQAETFRNQWVWIGMDEAVPLQEDEFYTYQIIGMQVITDNGERLGKITELIETGANDVYVVQGERREILLPAIPEVVIEVDVKENTMIVHLIEGLIE